MGCGYLNSLSTIRRMLSKLPFRLGNREFRPKLQLSTVSTDRARFRHIDDVERLDYYEKGGYHPIQIGDYLQKRYRIVHKLGHGSYSTIWLARDQQLSNYTAIKVGTASSSHSEINILTRLVKHASWGKGISGRLIPAVIDRFDICGPNGTHPCFVTAPAACSLADVIDASDFSPFQMYVARSIAAQLVMAVAYVHSAGFVHGDLHFGNLLLQMPMGIDDLTDEQLYQQYDPPEPEPVIPTDRQPLPSTGVPSHAYAPIWMGKPSEELLLSESRLLLSDFGTAFCPEKESRYESYTPLQIRPPEARFEPEKPLGFASDIWSLGCMIWAILGVKPFLGSWLFGPDSAVESQIDALGPLPDEWWEKWDAKKKTKSFDGNGKAKPEREVWTFEQRFEDSIQRPRRDDSMEVIGEDERRAIFEMIKGMLEFNPGDRLSAPQVLETEWMRRWAIPQAEKSWELKAPKG